MSKYNKQNRLDEKAISVLSDFFMNKHGDRFDLQYHGIKDSTPDTDGFLRLRKPTKEMAGDYLDKVIFFQLKGHGKPMSDGAFRCPKRLIEFCKTINLPTILFVVSNIDASSKKQDGAEIYWYYFSNVNAEILDHANKKISSGYKIPNLELLKTASVEHVDIFYEFIESLAKRDSLLDTPPEITDLAVAYKNAAIKIGSLLYLIGRASKTELNTIRKFLGIKNRQMEEILEGLKRQKLVYSSNNVVIFRKVNDRFKKDVGVNLLNETVSKIDIDLLLKAFPDHKYKQQIFKNLRQVRHPIIFEYFKKQAAALKQHV